MNVSRETGSRPESVHRARKLAPGIKQNDRQLGTLAVEYSRDMVQIQINFDSRVCTSLRHNVVETATVAVCGT